MLHKTPGDSVQAYDSIFEMRNRMTSCFIFLVDLGGRHQGALAQNLRGYNAARSRRASGGVTYQPVFAGF